MYTRHNRPFAKKYLYNLILKLRWKVKVRKNEFIRFWIWTLYCISTRDHQLIPSKHRCSTGVHTSTLDVSSIHTLYIVNKHCTVAYCRKSTQKLSKRCISWKIVGVLLPIDYIICLDCWTRAHLFPKLL